MNITSLKSEWIAAAESSQKLIVVLHGRGDSPAGFRWLPEALGFPNVNYLLLRAPDRYFTGFSWYDLPPNQGPGILRSRELLDSVFAEIFAEGYRSEDTILFGFSQGCLMTLEWGGRAAHRFAGLIGISGYCFDPQALALELSPEAKLNPWLITHGTRDDVLDFETTQKQVDFLQRAGLPLDFHSFIKTHTIDDADELPLLRRWIETHLLQPKTPG